MRAAHLQPTRPAWYDRTPLSVSNCFQQTTGPHATTIRYSYTVPSNRKTYFESGMVWLQRGTVAGAAAGATSFLRYTAFGQTLCTFLIASIATNAIGDQYGMNAGAAFIGYPGDLFEGVTVDQSTGGTIIYRNFSKWTEFDN